MNETQNGITEKPVYFDKTETWCVSPWGDILLVLVVTATLAVLVGATVWGVKHSE